MKFIKLTSFIFLCLPAMGITQQIDYYSLYASKRNEAAKLSFKVDYFQQSFGGTLVQCFEDVTIVKDDEDRLFGAKIVIENDSSILTYNGKEISQIHKKNKTIQSYNASENPSIFIKSTFYDKLVDYAFITESNLIEQIQDIPYKIIDTTVNGRDIVLYRIFLPDEEEFQNQVLEIFIDKESHLLVAKEIRIDFQGNQQINRWKYNDIIYSNDTKIDALEYDFHNSFEKTSFDLERMMVVLVGNAFPRFDGIWSDSKSPVKSDELQNEWLVIDFWFSACYPCIKSIPHVNSLYDKLNSEQIRFIGMNIIDKLEKDEARIRKFESYNPMRYKTVYPNNPKDFGQISYPSIIILDKDRKVVYLKDGYSETLEEEVLQFFASQGILKK